MWADAGPLVTALGPMAVVLVLVGDLIGFGFALFLARRRGFTRGRYRGRLIPVTMEWGGRQTDDEGAIEDKSP
jgi:hypothetical protein